MKKKDRLFQFTLILNNVDECTPNLEDHLYDAGCDDVLINFRNGTVYLDFDRRGNSLKEVILTAIEEVESSKLDVVVCGVAPDHLVTESEIAQRLSRTKQTISLWITGKRRTTTPFPHPKFKLSNKSPLWKWSEITEWLYANKIIEQKEIVDTASLIEDINAALDERNALTKKHRHELIKRLITIRKSNTRSHSHSHHRAA